MASVPRATLFSIMPRLAKPIAVLTALGGLGYTAKEGANLYEANNQIQTARMQGHELDLKLGNLQDQRREREHKAAISEIANQFQKERTENKEETERLLASLTDAHSAIGRAITENGTLKSNLTQAQTEVTQARAENGSLREEIEMAKETLLNTNSRLQMTEDQITKTNEQIAGVEKTLETKENRGEILKTIAKAKKSCVMMSSNEGKGKWSGFFLRTNDNELYLLTCGHSFVDAGDFALTKIKVDGQGFSFEITPPPFKNDRIAYFSPRDGTDLAIIPLPNAVKNIIPEDTGLRFRDFVKRPLEDGEDAFSIGNPIGLAFTATRRTITSANRLKPFEASTNTPYIQVNPSPNPGDSGSGLIDSMGEVIGMVDMADLRGYAKQGYAVSATHLKEVMERDCELSVMSPEEKLAMYMDAKPQVTLVSSTASSPPKTGIQNLPKYHETVALEISRRNKWMEQIQLAVAQFDKLKQFLNPTPSLLPVPPAPEPAEIAPPPPPEDSTTPMPEPLFDPPAPAPGSVIPSEKKIPAPNIPLQDEPLKEAPLPPPE